MTIEEFLTKHIEGYLFNDLRKMGEIQLTPPEIYGAAGYPMIASVLSGMELLGAILSASPFDKKRGYEYFNNYWENYLSNIFPQYKRDNLALLVYNLVRHGLAHTFLAKIGILVTKDEPNEHLKIDTKRQELTIDATKFYEDFEESYEKTVRPIVFNHPSSPFTTKNNMQARLNEIVKVYSEDSATYFSLLEPQKVTTTTTPSSTASTSIGGSSTPKAQPTRLEP